jgi:hypothetical protein
MHDDYPPSWTSWLTHDEPPGKPEVPPVHSLRSGAHTDSGDRYTTQTYPHAWHTTAASTGPVARSPIGEAMAAAASLLVVPEKQ